MLLWTCLFYSLPCKGWNKIIFEGKDDFTSFFCDSFDFALKQYPMISNIISRASDNDTENSMLLTSSLWYRTFEVI